MALEQLVGMGMSDGRRGTGRLRTALDLQSEPAITRSELEDRFLAICDGAGIRRPETNAWIVLPGGDVEVDFLWRRERLAVETDGRGVHARCTRRQVVRRPREIGSRLLALLD